MTSAPDVSTDPAGVEMSLTDPAGVEMGLTDLAGASVEMGLMPNTSSVDFSYNTTARRPYPPPPITDPVLLMHIRYMYHIYGYPVVLAVGTIGNILAYCVFTRTGFRKVSSIPYLAAIAVTDTGFLWTFIFTPLYQYHQVPVIVQAGVCQLMMFLNYVFTFLSIWFLVAMVVEKFIGVYWPLKKTTMCTPFRAKLVMSFMAVVAVACYSYLGYFMGPDIFWGKLQCMPWRELNVHFTNLTKIDTVVVAIIPYAVIILLTSLIVIRGCEYYRISAAVELWPRHTGPGTAPTQITVRVTRILFPVILVTTLSNLPLMVLRSTMVFGVPTVQVVMWNQIFYELYIINFAIKLFVYVICSGSFRRRSVSLFKSGFTRLRNICSGSSSNCDSNPQRINLEDMPQGNNCDARIGKTDV